MVSTMGLKAKVILCVVVCEILGILSGFSTVSSMDGWYDRLMHPPGTPPGWVFGVVWTILYGCMGAALALIWHHAPRSGAKWRALAMFFVQLLINLCWTPVFFGQRQIAVGLAIVAALLIAVFITVLAFHPLEKRASYLMLPYLFWVGYAAYLNGGILVLNGLG